MIKEIISQGIIPIPDGPLTAETGKYEQILEIPVTIREVSFPPSVYYVHFGFLPSEIVAGSEEDVETALNRLRNRLLDPPPSTKGAIEAISQYFREI